MSSINCWIDSLSYDAFLNALVYAFHCGHSRDEKCVGERRGNKKRDTKSDVGYPTHPGEGGRGELEVLQTMLLHLNYMFRMQTRESLSSASPPTKHTKNGASKETAYNDPEHEIVHVAAAQNVQADNLQGEVENPRAANVRIPVLPSELASILEMAGVQRSLDEIAKDYSVAREDSSDEDDATKRRLGAISDSGHFLGSFDGARSGFWWNEQLEMHQILDCDQSHADSKILQWSAMFPAGEDWCLGLVPDLASDKMLDDRKRHLLEILRIASRGKFLSTPPKNEDMSWFDPHDWFSLTSYLVSRLEIGLWTEYRRQSADTKIKNQLSITQKIDSLDFQGRSRVWSGACCAALRDELRETNNRLMQYKLQVGVKCTDETDQCNFIAGTFVLRESLIMQLVQPTSRTSKHEPLDASANVVIPLLKWLTPQSRFRRLVHNYLDESYSKEMLRALLSDIDVSQAGLKGKKKRKKKKRKQKDFADAGELSVPEEEHNPIHKVITANSSILGDENGSSNDTDDNDSQIESIIHTTARLSPAKQALLSSNDAKILVLRTIDDILDKVFQIAASGDVSDDALRDDSSDVEYASSTAVVSNKASVDAAMKFLNRQCDERSDSPQTMSFQSPTATPDADDSLFPQLCKDGLSVFDGAPLCLSGALDSFNGVACPRQKQDTIYNLIESSQRCNEQSSTAASVATSESNLCLDITCDDLESLDQSNKAVHFERWKINNSPYTTSPASPVLAPISARSTETPPPPTTPPPQLSPILVTLADLGKLRMEPNQAADLKSSKVSSPPRSPIKFSSVISLTDEAPLTRNCSRDDLRSIDERRRPHRRDRDHHSTGRPQLEWVNRNVDALLSYRNVVAQSVHRKHSHEGNQKSREEILPATTRNAKAAIAPKLNACAAPDFSHPRSSTSAPSSKEPMINKVLHLDVAYARSECAPEGIEDVSHCNVIPRANTDDTMTKDGATTISSVRSVCSPPVEEQLATVKEERDTYRDHCLMLGAENAKLRNLLASKACAPLFQSPSPFVMEQANPYFYAGHSNQFHFGPEYYRGGCSVRPVAAPMSDAGIHRGEHESSIRSEDGTDVQPSVIGMSVTQNNVSWQAVGDSLQSVGRRTSMGGTYAESDNSLEQNGGLESHTFSSFRHINHQDSFFGPMPVYVMRSRLSQDIDRFMQALKTQLKRTESRRMLVVDQITKSINAVWPRAQIKMYGSHMTRLCLPSSDMDFVICLPAVHKNAPAQAPGDLEGRNAINETNQKVLARKLKGESWLDQRSLKVIERTAVPVIKVSTKGSRSRVVQLDLSFDAKEHHGLEALDMIRHTLEEVPVIRPLVLVLKQFLLDRGLLTAYTGGISSYCLFLMVTRYCQEQSPSWCDCGSLLMGLLDFYGNFFDPRTTGISVGKRQYFSRSQVIQSPPPLSTQFYNEDQWNVSPQQFTELTRRNSFSDRSFGSAGKTGVPSRFQMLNRQFSLQGSFHAHATQSPAQPPHQPKAYSSGKPYTFDPIWVEDPLNPGNNVGRNAFRIFQVQRAFSDAHRALVAALEWDMNSVHEFEDDGEYPLLKCLLQNEDVFYDIIRD